MLANFPIREVVTIIILLLPGVLLFEKGVLRTRHLIYLYLPVAGLLIMMITAVWNRRFSTWMGELLFSVAAVASVMAALLVIWRIKGVDLDQLDKKRNRFSGRKSRKPDRKETEP